MAIGIIQPEDDVQSYGFLMGRLVHESISSDTVFDIFRRVLPNITGLIEHLQPEIARFTSPDTLVKFEGNTAHVTMDKIRRTDFLGYKDLLVTVPEGFEGKLADFLHMLNDQGSSLFSSADKFLNQYILELAAFLSNADVRIQMSSHDALFRQIAKEREGHLKQYKSFFKPGSTLSRQPLGKVVARFADVEEVFKQADLLARYQKKADYKLVASQLARASELLSLIRERVEKEDITKFSAPVVKNIAEGAYQVAAFVEYLSVHAYAVEMGISTANLMKERFDALMK